MKVEIKSAREFDKSGEKERACESGADTSRKIIRARDITRYNTYIPAW